MNRISQYITYAEATKSQTAIRHGIDNAPDAAQLASMQAVGSKVFDQVREHIGGPIAVTSMYRCAEVNRIIGGSRTSQHISGEAVDLDCDVFGIGSNGKAFEYILLNLEFDQLIWEYGDKNSPAWVHVSYREGNNRGDVLQAIRQGSRTIYERRI